YALKIWLDYVIEKLMITFKKLKLLLVKRIKPSG
ncbi:unnamed protein product, partial [marine sediment metagenome]